ncbi:MAG TPA: DMT family transporter [Gaiellaceae bacterium]|jgi:transporter family-2 protein|nr:DMT family transporter [Gaiellaceae bacterium]
MSSGTAVAVALTATAGLAGAVQAAVMGELGERVGIVPAVAFSVVVALLAGLAALLVWERSFAGIRAAAQEPAWLWIGGVMSVFIVLAVTVAPPRIGVAATIGVVIAGNLVSAALIDRYGLFGQDVIPIDRWRLLGLLLLAAGAALSLSRT